MMRSLFISLSRAGWAQRAIPRWGFAQKTASRFVAGETTEQAIGAIRDLNAQGINATLDHLGENTSSLESAHQATEEVLAMLAEIDRSGMSANVSIKLSQIGLTIDPEACRANLRQLLERAQNLGNFIRIDMEDATLTDATLAAYFGARQQGFNNVGIVIQSYLYRSPADVRQILEIQGKVRLCKGAYKEPPQVAYPQKADVDSQYDRLTTQLLAGAIAADLPRRSSDGCVPPIPALATHDEKRIRAAQVMAQNLKLPKDAFEFQMLYGIRRDLQAGLVAAGYPVRVYVPYGTHWYPYFMRRLAERPANVWFIASNFFRK
jgi:proline dehydrogenase